MKTTATVQRVKNGKPVDKKVEIDLAGVVPPKLGPKDLPEGTVDELVGAKVRASDMTRAFGDAIKAQAEKYKIKPSALPRYITALAADKIEDARAETEQLADLIG